MCCALTVLIFLGPRAGIIIWYLLRPVYWQAAPGSIILPCLGFFFMPWTTLMYMAVYPGGLSLINWLFLGLAVLVDLGAYGGGGYGNRDRFRR